VLEIDGVQPDRIERVANADELGELMNATSAAAASSPRTVVPFGGGTALGIGNRTEHIDLAVDTTGISGLIEYSPADLTVSVRAGTRLAELNVELAKHGQELPIDMPLAKSATIGGLIATAFAGPRRYGSGTLKDTLIGSSFVRGDGLVAKAGGMVVKNVSGFEVSRLLHGSWGTLAVITSANFKVTPIPKSDATLSILYPTIVDAIAGFRAIVAGGITPASAEVLASGNDVMLAIRLLGRDAGVADQVGKVPSLVRADVSHAGAGAESRAFWAELGDDWATGGENVQLVIGVRPRDIGSAIAGLDCSGAKIANLLVSPGTGTIRARIEQESIAPAELWSRLAPVTSLPGGSVIVEFAPLAWKRHVDIWGTKPEAVEVMRSLKVQFDPAGILNRGRMVI
jgi:glycolate oxidase FAD binding subunit